MNRLYLELGESVISKGVWILLPSMLFEILTCSVRLWTFMQRGQMESQQGCPEPQPEAHEQLPGDVGVWRWGRCAVPSTLHLQMPLSCPFNTCLSWHSSLSAICCLSHFLNCWFSWFTFWVKPAAFPCFCPLELWAHPATPPGVFVLAGPPPPLCRSHPSLPPSGPSPNATFSRKSARPPSSHPACSSDPHHLCFFYTFSRHIEMICLFVRLLFMAWPLPS